MKFVMSYSCGKDSTLALGKIIAQGHEPVGLLVMINEDLDRSWFHGTDHKLLGEISGALEIPLILCPAKGEVYHLSFEEGLIRAKELGAEMVGFGDIDIEDHREWGLARCRNTGLKSEYPLWQRERREIVEEVIAKGYDCIIKSIDNTVLPKSILGKKLDRETAAIMEECGADMCGENGEYHTIVMGGPIFKADVRYETGDVLDFGDRSVIDIQSKDKA